VKIYKIRNRDTGLFSTGGTYPRWEKVGKVWKARNHLTNHLTTVAVEGVYGSNADVVEYEVTEQATSIQTVPDLISGALQRREEKEAKRQAQLDRARREARLAQYEALKAEFETKV